MPIQTILVAIIAVWPVAFMFAFLTYLLSKQLNETISKLSDHITKTGDKLIILAGTRDGGAETGRALVASMKSPRYAEDTPNKSTKVAASPGVTLTAGVK